MKVVNFDRFSNSIFEKGEEQDTPSKSGIKYQENGEFKKKDTGKTAAINCIRFAREAVGVIKKLGPMLSAYSDQSINLSIKGVEKLSRDLDSDNPSFENNKKYWNGLKNLADRIYGEGKSHVITDEDGDNILKAYTDQLSALKDEAEKRKVKSEAGGKLNPTIYHDKKEDKSGIQSEYPDDAYYSDQRKKLKQAYEAQLDKSNMLVYNEKMKAAQYYTAAVASFVKGALIELEHMETEENDEDSNKSWIRTLTEGLKNIR